MPITVSGTSITFNDATTQTTAPAITGASGQVFNSNGTFTIPTGVTKLKVTVVGGGAAGTGSNSNECGNPSAGNAGGASSVASGNQSISSITGNGGGYGSANAQGANGNGVGGDINVAGSRGDSLTFGGLYAYGVGGGGAFAGGGAGGTAIKWLTGLTPGANLAVTRGAGGNGSGVQFGNGQAGIVIFEW